jgi:hypothetical protein
MTNKWIKLDKYVAESTRGGFANTGRAERNVEDLPQKNITGWESDDQVVAEEDKSEPLNPGSVDDQGIFIANWIKNKEKALPELPDKPPQPKVKEKGKGLIAWQHNPEVNEVSKKDKRDTSGMRSTDTPTKEPLVIDPTTGKLVPSTNPLDFGTKENPNLLTIRNEPEEVNEEDDKTPKEEKPKATTRMVKWYDKDLKKVVDVPYTSTKPVKEPSQDKGGENVNESAPPLPKHIIHKVEAEYGKGNPKAYQTLWKIYDKMKNEGYEEEMDEESSTGAIVGYSPNAWVSKSKRGSEKAIEGGERSGFKVVRESKENEVVGSYPIDQLNHDLSEILHEVKQYNVIIDTELLREFTWALKYETNINKQPRWKAKCNVLYNWSHGNWCHYNNKKKQLMENAYGPQYTQERVGMSDYEPHERLCYELKDHFNDNGVENVAIHPMGQDETPKDIGKAAMADFSDYATEPKVFVFINGQDDAHGLHVYGADDKRHTELLHRRENMSLDEVKKELMDIHEFVKGSVVQDENVEETRFGMKQKKHPQPAVEPMNESLGSKWNSLKRVLNG